MSGDQAVVDMLLRPALAEVAGSVGARRCLAELGTYLNQPVLCQVITQGFEEGLAKHRRIVHGIEAPR